MTKIDIASFLIKLMAFYLFIQFIVSFTVSITQAIRVLASFSDYPSPGAAAFAIGISFGIPLIWFGFCLLILRTSDRIASWIIRDDGEFGARLSLSLKELQVLGYNLIGLFLIAQAFPRILNLSARLRVETQTGHYYTIYYSGNYRPFRSTGYWTGRIFRLTRACQSLGIFSGKDTTGQIKTGQKRDIFK